MRNAVLISGLLVILFANVLMVYFRPRGIYGMEGFQENSMSNNAQGMAEVKEGFQGYSLTRAGGANTQYQPMGQYDDVKISTGNSVSAWRYTAPNESLMGAEFVPGDNDLFMFKNNQCKPECCGASFSCGGGCVCTTPQQRQYLAGRGGNRNSPEDSL
jgi:hypothetical protein